MENTTTSTKCPRNNQCSVATGLCPACKAKAEAWLAAAPKPAPLPALLPSLPVCKVDTKGIFRLTYSAWGIGSGR